MSYVVLQPDNLTNPTNDYVVTQESAWACALIERRKLNPPEYDAFTSFAAAEAERDTRNTHKAEANSSEWRAQPHAPAGYHGHSVTWNQP